MSLKPLPVLVHQHWHCFSPLFTVLGADMVRQKGGCGLAEECMTISGGPGFGPTVLKTQAPGTVAVPVWVLWSPSRSGALSNISSEDILLSFSLLRQGHMTLELGTSGPHVGVTGLSASRTTLGLCSAGDQTQDFVRARHALHQLRIPALSGL